MLGLGHVVLGEVPGGLGLQTYTHIGEYPGIGLVDVSESVLDTGYIVDELGNTLVDELDNNIIF